MPAYLSLRGHANTNSDNQEIEIVVAIHAESGQSPTTGAQ